MLDRFARARDDESLLDVVGIRPPHAGIRLPFWVGSLGVEMREVMIGEAIPVGVDTRDPERWNAKLELLYDAALSTFGARCLWNVKPSKSAQCLRASGGMDAWRLATEIRDAIADAAG